MSKMVNMREERDWIGRKRYVMYDTDDRPRTFHEIEDAKIGDMFYGWLKLSFVPSAVVFCLYLWPWETYWNGDGEMARFGYPWAALFMGFGVLWLLNIPNYVIAIIRSVALHSVTGGK